MAKLAPHFPRASGDWTAGVPMPGGDFAVADFDDLVEELIRGYPFLTPAWAKRLMRAYGTESRDILGEAEEAADLGRDFGATLTEAEVIWLMEREYAREAEDVIWRRSKLGLRLGADQVAELAGFMAARRGPE